MSAILSADALNDFISPGVACIKPVETLPASQQPPTTNEAVLDDIAPPPRPPPAAISLTDCLACSGCVTSAEAVLVSLQSHAEVLAVLDAAPALGVVESRPGEYALVERPPLQSTKPFNSSCCGGGGGTQDGSTPAHDHTHPPSPQPKLLVVSVAPQVRASLAAACGPSPAHTTSAEAGHMLEHLFRGPAGLAAGGAFGSAFAYVVDTNVAREACLVLGADEVLGPPPDSPFSCPFPPSPSTTPPPKPTITSSCPGWVCYAEKTHPHVLPHLSRVKSPQALAGTLVKSVLGARLGIPAARIWHLAVMPCFDKKLEASRAELTDEAWGGEGSASQSTSTSTSTPTSSPTRDVDCVITSKEILMLAESRGIDFFKLPRTPLAPTSVFPDPVISRFLFPPAPGPWRTVPDAGPSGGNLYFVLQAAAARHPGGGARITTTRGRNADVVEYAVEAPGGAVVLRAARYYGFRNIQNLVRKLKPARPSRVLAGRTVGARRSANGSSSAGASEYAYVEVMACPGGCTNGGGQIKADDAVVVERLGLLANPGPAEHKAWLAAVDEAYFSSEEGDGDGGPEAEVGGGQKDDAAPEASDGAVVGGAISPARIRGVLAHWAASTGIPLDRLVLTTFREVVSDVGKDMTDTERAAQLAGKIGGGW